MTADSHAENNLDEQRSAAIVALLAAGLEPPPAKNAMVSALADARRAVAALRSQGHDLNGWLTAEMRLRGLRENAATAAALEITDHRNDTAALYRQRYPERVAHLDEFLAHIDS